MFLETLLYGVMSAAASIGRKIDNENSKKNTMKINQEGYTQCIGRTGQFYVNGEETYQWSERDKYGNMHDLTIGKNSGKVYSDSYDRMLKRENEYAEEKKRKAVEYGELTYEKFCPQLTIPAQTEIKTGKVITCFGEFFNHKTNDTTYRKWYLQPSQKGRFEYNRTTKGDKGIEITKEEYKKLSLWCHQLEGIPSDPKILNELWGYDCF